MLNTCKVLVKVTLGVSLKFLVFANLESVGCEVQYIFQEKKAEKLIIILKQQTLPFFVSSHNLGTKNY